MIKTFCDRCEGEIEKIQKAATIRFIPFGYIHACLWDEVPYKQLCQPCFSALESFLKTKKQKKSTKRKTEKPIITKEGKILMPNLGII